MRALITGVLGQDGSYLAGQLIAEGHEVFGLVRRSNVRSVATLLLGDLLDQESLDRAVLAARPDVVYHLAAVTAPGAGWGAVQPPLLADVTGLGTLRLLDSLVQCAPDARLVNASSSAIYDVGRYGLYGLAKRFAHDAVAGYRGRIWASNAVLYSHTSPRQDPRFLARRICTAVARREWITLGDVDSRRDWGWAPDYCRALTTIAEQDKPGDWVVNTRQRHSVRTLVVAALAATGRMWRDSINIDGNAPRVPDELAHPGTHDHAVDIGWRPTVGLEDLVGHLVNAAHRTRP